MAEKEAVVKQMQAEYPANLSSIYLGVLIQYLPDMCKRKQLMAIRTFLNEPWVWTTLTL
jgi:hypothetical protein